MADSPVIYQFRCKICKLANTDSALFKDLHSQVLETGMSLNRAMNYFNARIDAENLQVPKLNNQNMSAHFNSHIAIPDRVNSEMNKLEATAGAAPLTSVNPTLGHEIEDMVRRRVGNDVNDYLNLDSLRSQMMEKLEFLDELVAREKDGEKVVDLDAMSQYTTLIKEIRNTIVDLNKIRQSKQLMSMVIKSLVEKQTFTVVKELSREYDKVKRDLLEAGVDNTIVVRIDQGMRVKLAEIVASTARAAIQDVMISYKLN